MTAADCIHQLAQRHFGINGDVVLIDDAFHAHQGEDGLVCVVRDELSLACKTHAIDAMRLEDVDGEVRADANNHQWQQ